MVCFGSFAVLVNVLVVYMDNAVWKSGATWRTEGTAVLRVLQIVQFCTPLGDWFLRMAPRWLLYLSGAGAYKLEAYGWILVMLPHGNSFSKVVFVVALYSNVMSI